MGIEMEAIKNEKLESAPEDRIHFMTGRGLSDLTTQTILFFPIYKLDDSTEPTAMVVSELFGPYMEWNNGHYYCTSDCLSIKTTALASSTASNLQTNLGWNSVGGL